jgi:FMN reductase
MSGVVVICGHPHPESRTLQLARAVGERFARHRGHAAPVVVDVAALGSALLAPADHATGRALMDIQDSALLIVATPTYRGSYTGVLKMLLDALPANALAGVVAVPVVTADVQPQADAAEALLARLLSELGAEVVAFGLTAIESELSDPVAVAEQYTAAIGL